MKHLFEKETGERLTLEIDLTDRLPTSATPSTVAVTATDETLGTSASSILPSATGTASGAIISFAVYSGTTAHDYDVKVLTTLSNSDVLKENVILKVK